MTDLLNLERQAFRSASDRNHQLGSWTVYENGTRAAARCEHCGLEAYVVTRPQPNEIDVSGPAVALGCPVTRDDEKTPATVFAGYDDDNDTVF